MTPKIMRGDYNRGDPTSEVTPLERRKHDKHFIGIVTENFTKNDEASIFSTLPDRQAQPKRYDPDTLPVEIKGRKRWIFNENNRMG